MSSNLGTRWFDLYVVICFYWCWKRLKINAKRGWNGQITFLQPYACINLSPIITGGTKRSELIFNAILYLSSFETCLGRLVDPRLNIDCTKGGKCRCFVLTNKWRSWVQSALHAMWVWQYRSAIEPLNRITSIQLNLFGENYGCSQVIRDYIILSLLGYLAYSIKMCQRIIIFTPIPALIAFTGTTKLTDPHYSQQQAGLRKIAKVLPNTTK